MPTPRSFKTWPIGADVPSPTSHDRSRVRSVAAAVTAGVLTMGLAACGDDSPAPVADGPQDSVPTPDTTPDTTVAPDEPAIEHPVGADEVVVEIGYEGGFMPVEGIFTQLPSLLVTGDGSHFTQGPVPAIYPGQLLPNVQVASLGEDGIQALLELAAEHGLFTEREYESPDNVADAPDTVVTIHANGETYVHRAYALGIGSGLAGDAEEGDRAELQAFVDAARESVDLADTVAFEPDTYLVLATPVTDLGAYELEPTLVDWPEDITVSLVDAVDCLAMPADEVGELFTTANQLTFFVENDVTYQLSVKPQLAGDAC